MEVSSLLPLLSGWVFTQENSIIYKQTTFSLIRVAVGVFCKSAHAQVCTHSGVTSNAEVRH